MKTMDQVAIYLLLGAALSAAIIANVRTRRLDDETHRHLALLSAGHLLQHHQLDSLRRGVR